MDECTFNITIEVMETIRNGIMSHHTYLLEQLEVKYMVYIQQLLMQKHKIIAKIQKDFRDELCALNTLYTRLMAPQIKVELDCDNIESDTKTNHMNCIPMDNDNTLPSECIIPHTRNVPSLEAHSHARQNTSQTNASHGHKPQIKIVCPQLETVPTPKPRRSRKCPSEPMKPLKCPYPTCSQTRATLATLEKHIRIRHTKRRFTCNYPGCGKTYTRNSSLKDHYRTHTGEKPFKCTHPGCMKAFTRPCRLRDHVRIHSTEKLYQCPFCYKPFRTFGARNGHIRRRSITNCKVDMPEPE
eukprot:242468_1